MHAFAREMRLSETSFVQSADGAGGRLPQPHLDDQRARSPSPGIRRSAPRPRWRACGARRAYVRAGDARRAASRSTSRSTATSRTSPCCRSRPSSARSSIPAEVLGARRPGRRRRAPRAAVPVRLHRAADVIAPVARRRRAGRVWPDYDAHRAAARAAGGVVLYRGPRRRGGRHRARRGPSRRSAETGEDPATGSAAGRSAPTSPAHGRAARSSHAGRRDGPRAPACAPRSRATACGSAATSSSWSTAPSSWTPDVRRTPRAHPRAPRGRRIRGPRRPRNGGRRAPASLRRGPPGPAARAATAPWSARVAARHSHAAARRARRQGPPSQRRVSGCAVMPCTTIEATTQTIVVHTTTRCSAGVRTPAPVTTAA